MDPNSTREQNHVPPSSSKSAREKYLPDRYDYPRRCGRSGIEMILVGDSLAQVVLGYDSHRPSR